MPFERFVAIGDSFTEGVGDELRPDGRELGWADRFAAHLVAESPGLRYANLAIRGRKAPEVHAEQFEAALALQPDLVSVAAGTNDVLRWNCNPDVVADHLNDMVAGFRDIGATTIMFELADMSEFNAVSRLVSDRVKTINKHLRTIADFHGATLVKLPTEFLKKPDIWAADRLHLNPVGHARVAAYVAGQFNVPVSSDEPPVGTLARRAQLPWRVVDDAAWFSTFLVPWLGRRVTGRSSGDNVTPKLPDLNTL